MLGQKDAIMYEVLESITFVLAYPTIQYIAQLVVKFYRYTRKIVRKKDDGKETF